MTEKKYIDSEVAFNAILKLVPKVDDDGYCWVIRGDAATAIDKIPAADVRPVVLCKDCKHYEQLDLFRNSPAWSGMCHYWNCHATREDGFCFKAAKREEKKMSLTMHLYTPEFCDGNYCCKDCEECSIGRRIEEEESAGYDEPDDSQLEMGFNPYMGGYDFDC